MTRVYDQILGVNWTQLMDFSSWIGVLICEVWKDAVVKTFWWNLDLPQGFCFLSLGKEEFGF